MVEEVRGYLSDMIDAIATKRYDDLQQITEFAPAAKALHISRIDSYIELRRKIERNSYL